MMERIDPRDRELARMLVNYSVAAKPGDLVIVHCTGSTTIGLGAACVEECARVGAAAYFRFTEQEILKAFISNATAKAIERWKEHDLLSMQNATCYLGIRGSDNIFEESDVPREKMDTYNKVYYQPVHLEERVKRTRWCVMRYPNPSMAQLAQKSRADFAKFYYDVCCVDYAKMAKAVEPLKKLMDKTDKVHIKGPGTDLTFSMKGIPSVPCCGRHNIPDGECFSAPVKDSMEGTVQFNTPTSEDGVGFENIFLRFKKGRVVEHKGANAEQTRKLGEILDQDAGARTVGEYAIGFNPHVNHAMRDILFDEKINGSFHMALGQCYDDAPNGNKSALHWDLVCIQRPDYGGGEIWFDGKLIRKDGIFMVPELKGLNPDALTGAKAKPAKKAAKKK